jgi:hypothetical protein
VPPELGAWPQFSGAEMNDVAAHVSGAPSAAIQEDGGLRGSAEEVRKTNLFSPLASCANLRV